MTGPITLGAASLMGALVAATFLARWWFSVEPAARPHAAIVDTRFVHCNVCGVATAATVHGHLVLCAEGHQIGGTQ